MFAHKGFHGATVEDVARAAGYSPAALYRHFRSRDELFAAVWLGVAAELDRLFVEAARQAGPLQARLRWLVEALIALREAHPAPLAAFLAQRPYVASAAASEFEREARGWYDRHVRHLADLMRAGEAEGALRPGSADGASLLFKGLLYEFAYRLITSPGGAPPAAQAEELLSLFQRGAGVPPASPRRTVP